jgi:hypothetical protein
VTRARRSPSPGWPCRQALWRWSSALLTTTPRAMTSTSEPSRRSSRTSSNGRWRQPNQCSCMAKPSTIRTVAPSQVPKGTPPGHLRRDAPTCSGG